MSEEVNVWRSIISPAGPGEAASYSIRLAGGKQTECHYLQVTPSNYTHTYFDS